MKSIRLALHTTITKVTVIIGRTVLLALAVLAGLVLMGLLAGGGADAQHAAPTQQVPVSAPVQSPSERTDGTADHGLFNPSATLDTSRVDDLREDREGKCLAGDGVMTPAGQCVDAIAVWNDEVDPAVWADLRAAGYPRDIDHSDGHATALRVPAEFVILGGETGEELLAVDMTRPLTPRLLG